MIILFTLGSNLRKIEVGHIQEKRNIFAILVKKDKSQSEKNYNENAKCVIKHFVCYINCHGKNWTQ